MNLYRIKNWSKLFENNRTRELKHMAWVPIPNSHDGDGFTALVCREDGPELYGAWVVILQVASRCRDTAGSCGGRGTLLRDCGKPHNSASLARITRFPEAIIEKALTVLCSDDVGWLEVVDCSEVTAAKLQIPHPPAEIPHPPAEIPHLTPLELNGTEQKGTEGTEPSGEVQVLNWLNEKSGKAFRETETNLGFILGRLREPGVDLAGVKKMIERQCARWNGTDQAEYLRPETLFNKTKFDAYYAAKDQPIEPKQNGSAASALRPGEQLRAIVAEIERHIANPQSLQFGGVDKVTLEQRADLKALRAKKVALEGGMARA